MVKAPWAPWWRQEHSLALLFPILVVNYLQHPQEPCWEGEITLPRSISSSWELPP